MKRRKWDDKLKAQVVIEGLKGRPVGELCNEYQIGQTAYYRWRDQFLANAGKVFQVEKVDQRAERLVDENRRLKGVIGDLTLELKKNDW
jgi:transposase-like protein